MLYWYSTSWEGWVRCSLRKKKVRTLYYLQKENPTNKAKNIFLILSEENSLCLSSLIQRRELQVWEGDLVVHSQVCSHDMSITVAPSQLSQCRAGWLPGSMLGYEHAATWLSTPAVQPAGTARLFNPCHWGTSSPMLPHCKLSWYLALQ